jgi:hypothetical protein
MWMITCVIVVLTGVLVNLPESISFSIALILALFPISYFGYFGVIEGIFAFFPPGDYRD